MVKEQRSNELILAKVGDLLIGTSEKDFKI